MRLVGIVATCLALASCMTASGTYKMAEKGGCADQDFVTHVSGGGHCLSIEVWKSKEVFDGPVTLVVALHGDSGPGQFEGIFREMLVPNPEFKKMNTVLVAIASIGYRGGNGWSSGYQIQNQQNDKRARYNKETAESVIDAVRSLSDHYGAHKIFGWGNSGGSAIWAGAVGALPDKIPANLNELILVACPCDLPIQAAQVPPMFLAGPTL